MRIFQRLRKKLRWHAIDLMARLGIGDEEVLRQGRRPAYGRAEPRLLSIPRDGEAFNAYDALHGSYSSPEHCARIPHAIWVSVNGAAEAIRYYPAGLNPVHNPIALLYFPGDVVLRTSRGVRLVGKTYTQKTPDQLIELMSEWAADAGAPALYMGRPGIFGSSGDHEKRRLPYEIDLMDRALDLLKDQHGIGRFILVGQSGGAQIAAALLNRRRDISASVMTAGLLSVHHTVRRWRRTRPVPGGAAYPVEAFYDPLCEIERIRRDPAPEIYVISDPRDSVVPLHSQLQYLRKLSSSGFEPHHIYAHAEGPKHHNLGAHGRRAAALLARGAGVRDVRRAMVDMDAENLSAEGKAIFPGAGDQRPSRPAGNIGFS